MIQIPRDQSKEECKNANVVELIKLKKFKSFEEMVESGQFRILYRWALCKKRTEMRAHLLSGGFDDEEDDPDHVLEHCDSDESLENKFETEATRDPTVVAELEDCPNTLNSENMEHMIVKDESSEEYKESNEMRGCTGLVSIVRERDEIFSQFF